MKLIHFTAEWCQPCKMMKPVIESIMNDRPDIEYQPIDIDESPETARDYGVMGVPSFILMDDSGKVLGRTAGAKIRAEFEKAIGL